MDYIELSDSTRTRDGLAAMLDAAEDGLGVYGERLYVELPIALLIIAIAKRAEDRPDWFPRGKWATIQSLQGECDAQLDTLFTDTPTQDENR